MICNERIITSKNGCFERLVYWDKERLKFLGDGFLVQKVIRQTDIKGPFCPADSTEDVFNHTYYETWKLENGAPVYEGGINFDFDDRWLYTVTNIIDPVGAVLKDYSSKYKSSGTITMTGILYFVPKEHPFTHSLLSGFSQRKVPFAGDLLSAYNCAVEDHFQPIYEHHFSHGWKLDEDNEFISAVIGEMRKQKLSLEDCKSYLMPCFSHLSLYEKLVESVLQEYGAEEA